MEMRNNYKETLIKSPAEIVSVSDDTHQKRILNLSKQIWGGLVSAQVTSETCLKEMRKFYEKKLDNNTNYSNYINWYNSWIMFLI